MRGLAEVSGRKSVRRISEYVLGRRADQSLQQFVNQSSWAWEPVRQQLAEDAAAILSPSAWVVEEAVMPKNGNSSVGVERQYSQAAGRVLNCQIGLALMVSGQAGAVPVNWRLLLPRSWDSDEIRRSRSRVPDHERHRSRWHFLFDMLDEITLGWGMKPLPVVVDDYLIEAWKPGEPSKVTFVACRGNHQKPNKRTGRTRSTTLQQLVKGSELTEGMQIGPWNTTPCLMLSTELMGQGGVVVNALQSPGERLLPLRTPDSPGSADEEIRDKTGIPYPNAIHTPAREGKRARTVDGFQVPEKDLGWFGQLLARTGAAGLTAFSGGGPATARYLTAHQGQKHYAAPTFAATSSYQDADIEIGGTKFVGTDHVFRMETVHIEAFSGMGFGSVRTDRRRPPGRVPASSLRTTLHTARHPRSREEMERPDLVPRRRHRHGPEHPAHSQTAPTLNQKFVRSFWYTCSASGGAT